ncbi:hypothetical protein D3C87_1354920 [compost metagenome]
MPARRVVDLGAEAQGCGRCSDDGLRICARVPAQEIGPHEHEFPLPETFTIGGHLFLRPQMGDARIREAAQLLRDAGKLGSHRRVFQAWGAQDARLDQRAAVLRRQQRAQTRVFPVRVRAADDIRSRLFGCGALSYANNHRSGVGLSADGFQRARKRALGACLAGGRADVGRENGRIEREGSGVGVFGRGHKADNGGCNGANGARAVVHFEYADAVVIGVKSSHEKALRSC